MKLSRDCGLSVRAWSIITAVVELIFAFLIGTLAVICWLRVDKPIQFGYQSPVEDGNSTVLNTPKNIAHRQRGLEGCVITWCLTIILASCAWRVISGAMIILGVMKGLPLMMQYWIAYKGLSLIIALFVVIASFTSRSVMPSAILFLVADLATAYFIRILIPEIDRVSRGKGGGLVPNETYRKGSKD